MFRSQGPSKRYSNNLRIIRMMEGVSQENLAAEIGVDPAIIGRIERGVIRGTQEQRQLLSQFFGIEEPLLFEEKKDER